jgi:hypothetical protein
MMSTGHGYWGSVGNWVMIALNIVVVSLSSWPVDHNEPRDQLISIS